MKIALKPMGSSWQGGGRGILTSRFAGRIVGGIARVLCRMADVECG